MVIELCEFNEKYSVGQNGKAGHRFGMQLNFDYKLYAKLL